MTIHIDDEALAVGRSLLPDVVSYKAFHAPDEVFATIPVDLADHRGAWRQVTFPELASAVDHAAWWITETFVDGRAGYVIAYLAANDIRYAVFSLACIKTGRVAFLPSTRNLSATHSHLLKAVGHQSLVYTQDRLSIVQEIKATHPSMRLQELPDLEALLKRPARPYAYEKTFDTEIYKVIIIMHSSGTTGMPKPVHLTNGYFACYDNLSKMKPTPDGRHLMADTTPS